MSVDVRARDFVEVRGYRKGIVVVRELCEDRSEARHLMHGWRAVGHLDWDIRPVGSDWSDHDIAAGIDHTGAPRQE
jgi:hypothetical protein